MLVSIVAQYVIKNSIVRHLRQASSWNFPKLSTTIVGWFGQSFIFETGCLAIISHLVDWNLLFLYDTWVASNGQADVQSNNTHCYYVANQAA